MRKFLMVCLSTLIILGFMTPATLAQGGCPATLPAVSGHQVITSVLLAPAHTEEMSTSVPEIFYQQMVEVDFPPDTRVLISSSPNFLAPTCVDDVLVISSAAGQFTFDYRSADRSRIVHLSPLDLDVTRLFDAGQGTAAVVLQDVAPEFHSNSDLYLVGVIAPELPPSLLPSAASGMVEEPVTQGPPATEALPTASPVVPETPTPPSSAMISPPATPDEALTTLWPLPLWVVVVGIVLLSSIVLGVIIWLKDRHRLRPTGEIDVLLNGRSVAGMNLPIDLGKFKKSVVSMGSDEACDIRPPGENLPPIMAYFRAEIDVFDQVETVVDLVDPQTQEAVDSRPLRSGDILPIYPFTVVYTNYIETQEEPIILEGGYSV